MTALTIALVRSAAMNLPRGRRDRLAWVTRPTSDVAHVYVGLLTPSGRFAAATGRTVCRARTRRLRVIYGTGSSLDLRGRRVCHRCSARLLPWRAEQSLTRDQEKAKYTHLAVADFAAVEHLVATAEESHAFGRVVLMVAGGKPLGRPSEMSPSKRALRDLHEAIALHRKALYVAERTPEEVAAIHQLREDQMENTAQIMRNRRREVATQAAREKRRAGVRLTPWEKQLIAS